MKVVFLTIVAVFCLALFLPLSRARASEPQTEASALQARIDELGQEIDRLKALQTGQTTAPLSLAVPVADALTGQCASCGTAAAGTSTVRVRVSVRSGQRQGLFGRRGGRRGGCG